MKPSEVFGIVVRTIGFGVVIFGLWNILGGIVAMVEMLAEAPKPSEAPYSSLTYFGMGVPECLCGLLCCFFADAIVRFTYRDK